MTGTTRFLWLFSLLSLACTGGGDGGEAAGGDGASGPSDLDAGISDAAQQAWSCDPSLPFGAPRPVEELYPGSSSQPWISGDGLRLAFTFYEWDPSGSVLETRITERGDRNAVFQTPRPIVIPNIDEYFTEITMSADGQWLYFPYQGQIMRAPATGDLATFGNAEVVALDVPSSTLYPEYPRMVGGTLYLSLRESNWRRSIYAFDLETGASQPVLFDAGDIFSYALSENGLYLYVSFDVGGLETYRASRTSTSQPFSQLSYIDALNPPDVEDGHYRVSAISADDCEVFGGRSDANGDLHLWRSRRGE